MKRNKKLFFLCLLFTCFSCIIYGQVKTKSQLQRQKTENLRKIKEAEKILFQTERKKENSIGQLTALIQQIIVRQELILAITLEIEYLNNEIVETESIIISLENDLANLKKEYASMVYNAYKASYGVNTLSFLFSAESFNQFFMRLKYIEFYGKERRNQAREIKFVSTSLEFELDRINQKKFEKNDLLSTQVSETGNLNSTKQKQKLLIAQLSKSEKKIRDEISDWIIANEALEKRIADIVKEEIRRNSIARNKRIHSD